MTTGIYTITNLKNRHCYVGQSVSVEDRLRVHLNNLRRGAGSIVLQGAFNKYGENVFEFKLIRVCKTKDLVKWEQYYIDTLDSCYNMAPATGSPLGRSWSETSKQALSEKRKGIALPAFVYKKLARLLQGNQHALGSKHPMSPEHKAKISKSKLGHLGVVHTPETKLKISKASKEMWKMRKENSNGNK